MARRIDNTREINPINVYEGIGRIAALTTLLDENNSPPHPFPDQIPALREPERCGRLVLQKWLEGTEEPLTPLMQAIGERWNALRRQLEHVQSLKAPPQSMMLDVVPFFYAELELVELKKERLERGLSVIEFAELLDVSLHTLARIESGTRPISARLEKSLSVLKV